MHLDLWFFNVKTKWSNVMLNNEQIENINLAGKIVFSTASKDGQPRSIYVIPSKITSESIVISNIQMNKTLQNVKENNRCFINVFIPQRDDLQYKIEGIANVYDKGELFENIKCFEETNNLPQELKVHSIIVVSITKIEQSNG